MEQINTTIPVNIKERRELSEEIKSLLANYDFTPGLNRIFGEILDAVRPTVAQTGFNYRTDTDRRAIYTLTDQVVTMKGITFSQDGDIEDVTFKDTDGHYKRDSASHFVPLDDREIEQVVYRPVPDSVRSGYSPSSDLLAVIDLGYPEEDEDGNPVEPTLGIIYRDSAPLDHKQWIISRVFTTPEQERALPDRLADSQVKILGSVC